MTKINYDDFDFDSMSTKEKTEWKKTYMYDVEELKSSEKEDKIDENEEKLEEDGEQENDSFDEENLDMNNSTDEVTSTENVDMNILISSIEAIIDKKLNEINDKNKKKVNETYDKIAVINNKLDSLSSISKNMDAFKRAVDANKAKEDELFEELEMYRKNKEFLKIKSYLLNVVNMHYEIKKSLDEYVTGKTEIIEDIGEKGYRAVVDQLNYFLDMLESIMQAYCIIVENYSIESEFMPSEQKIIKTEPTDDESLNGTISRVVSPCYKYNEHVLRVANVYCYKYGKKDGM